MTSRDDRMEAGDRQAADGAQPSALADDVAAFLALLGRLWRARFAMFFAILVALALAIGLAQIMDKKYMVIMRLIPSQTSEVVLGPQANSAAIGGILSLGRSQDVRPSPFMRFNETLYSQAVAERMIELDPGIMPVIFEGQWDAETGTWKQPDGPLSGVGRTIKAALGRDEWRAPDARLLRKFIMNEVVFAESGRMGVYDMSFEFQDPDFARHFMRLLFTSADNIVRESDIRWTRAMEQFIAERLEEVTQIDQRAELQRLRGQNERMLILASVDEPYSAMLFDGPVVSADPTSPNVPKMFVYIAAFLVGVTMVIALLRKPREVREARRRRR